MAAATQPSAPNHLVIPRAVDHILFSNGDDQRIFCLYKGNVRQLMMFSLDRPNPILKRFMMDTPCAPPSFDRIIGITQAKKDEISILSEVKSCHLITIMTYHVGSKVLASSKRLLNLASVKELRPHGATHVRWIGGNRFQLHSSTSRYEVHLRDSEGNNNVLQGRGGLRLVEIDFDNLEILYNEEASQVRTKVHEDLHIGGWFHGFLFGIWSQHQMRDSIISWELKNRKLKVIHHVQPQPPNYIIHLQLVKYGDSVMLFALETEAKKKHKDSQGAVYFDSFSVVMIDDQGNKTHFDFPLDQYVFYHPKMIVRYHQSSQTFDLVVHAQELSKQQQQADLKTSIAALLTGKQPLWHFKNIPPNPFIIFLGTMPVEVLKRALVSTREECLHHMMLRLDEDGSGEVSRNELRSWYEKHEIDYKTGIHFITFWKMTGRGDDTEICIVELEAIIHEFEWKASFIGNYILDWKAFGVICAYLQVGCLWIHAINIHTTSGKEWPMVLWFRVVFMAIFINMVVSIWIETKRQSIKKICDILDAFYAEAEIEELHHQSTASQPRKSSHATKKGDVTVLSLKLLHKI